MKGNDIIIKVVAYFMVPLIMLFAIYVQMHGEITPGGGFQAGVILATAVILYSLAFSDSSFLNIISLENLQIFAAIGVFIYLSTGILCILQGGNLLEYSSIFTSGGIFSNELEYL